MIFLSLLMGAILQVVTPTAEPVYHEDFLREIAQLSDKISLPDLFHVVRQRKERKISEFSEKLTIPEFLRIVKQARNDERYDIDDEEESHLGCGRRPTVSTMKFLDRICEDCYSLYRDFDVYQMCRFKHWFNSLHQNFLLNFLPCHLLTNSDITNNVSFSGKNLLLHQSRSYYNGNNSL